MKLLSVPIVVALACITAASGCSVTGSTPTDIAPSQSGTAAPASDAEQVDPQVLNDAVQGVFLVPGPEQQRAMRVWRFSDNAGLAACGRTAPDDLTSTFDRYDQAHYADLDLIARKGLSEISSEEASRERPESDCRVKALPHMAAWFSLSSDWFHATQAAVQAPTVTATLPGVTSCLRDRSGLTIDPTDPTSTYLGEADRQLSGSSDDAQWQEGMDRYSQIYVACTPPYFDALKAELVSRRTPLVERHRETLTAFARDLVAAGYTP